ncbi:B3 domain-containing protein [Cardamine amara subsp. amara]|uniref:B3 domain-containing protein n=1 Tax=Cardamine amara subsp. amara TaxID=228776 RepID=A0ABD1AVR4_CARAN
MASNNEFGRCKEENKRQSFFKILQRADLSSENMRALPHDFVRSFSDNELSGNMKIKAKWGSSWEIELAKNPRFFFLERSGWQKFVRDNGLGDNEFATFTHERDMSFALNIFKQDGKEILKAPQLVVSKWAVHVHNGPSIIVQFYCGQILSVSINGQDHKRPSPLTPM